MDGWNGIKNKSKEHEGDAAGTVLNYLDLNDDVERFFDNEEKGRTEASRNTNRTFSLAETGDNDKNLSFQQKAQEKGSWLIGTLGPEIIVAPTISVIGKGAKNGFSKLARRMLTKKKPKSKITDRATMEVMENARKLAANTLNVRDIESANGLSIENGLTPVFIAKEKAKTYNGIHFTLSKNSTKEEKKVVDILNSIIDGGVENIDLTDIIKNGADENLVNIKLGEMKNSLYSQAMAALKQEIGIDPRLLQKYERALGDKLDDYMNNMYGVSAKMIYKDQIPDNQKITKQKLLEAKKKAKEELYLDQDDDLPTEFVKTSTEAEKEKLLRDSELSLLKEQKQKKMKSADLDAIEERKNALKGYINDADNSRMDNNAWVAFDNFLDNIHSLDEFGGLEKYIKTVGKEQARREINTLLANGKEKDLLNTLKQIGKGTLKTFGNGFKYGGQIVLSSNAIKNGIDTANDYFETAIANAENPMYDENGNQTFNAKKTYTDLNGMIDDKNTKPIPTLDAKGNEKSADAVIENDKPTVDDRVYLDNLYRQVKQPGPTSILKKVTGVVADLLDINENDPTKQDMDKVDTILRSVFTNKQIDALSNTQKLELLRAIGQEYSNKNSKLSPAIKSHYKSIIDELKKQ